MLSPSPSRRSLLQDSKPLVANPAEPPQFAVDHAKAVIDAMQVEDKDAPDSVAEAGPKSLVAQLAIYRCSFWFLKPQKGALEKENQPSASDDSATQTLQPQV